ncbi:MAG: hypothetical protein NWF06_03020 [Candidatus Bathyarchaeota archaeon]|nr:hypothetical protein [Candidatus Bathyarchaeum sp.]
MKNTHMHKKIVTPKVIFLMLLLTLSLFLVQLPAVSAQDAAASFTGVTYDAGVDTDDDGYFDYLGFGIELNVTVAATYTVEAGGIYDAAANYIIGVTTNSTYLTTGIHVVYINLNTTEVYATGVNPTYLAGANLYDDSDTLIDELTDLTFSTTYSYDEFQRPNIIIEINELEREIILGQAGSIYVTNVFRITNVGSWANSLTLGFPEDAYDIELRDEMGTLETTMEDNIMTVSLRRTVDTNETETLYLFYHLPWDDHITQQNGVDYNLRSTFYEQFNLTIGKLTVSVTLPEGAEFQSSPTLNPDSIEKSGNQETISFSFSSVTPSDDLNFEINYSYNVFWSSLYPTLWVGLLAVVGSAIFFLLGTPKTIIAPVIQVPTQDLKNFVTAYEEKMTIRSEIEALEERLQKGKIPRRRYKVRKKMLDGRLSSVSRTLSTIGATLRASGSNYASMMRQLEVAEAKLEGTERDLQRVKARYNRGEISKGAYGKLLEEYQSRIEAAEATIDGVLLRLRD